MSTELNNNEKIKRNMEVAMEWMDELDCRISVVSVHGSGVTLIVNNYSIEFSNKILDIARDKGISFNIERNNRNDYLYYTSNEIGLDIVFTG